MALGDLVRTIFVRLKEDGADEVKAAIDDVALRAKALGEMDPTVHIGVDERGLFSQLGAFRTELEALKMGFGSSDPSSLPNLISNLQKLGNSTDSSRVKAAALALELRALKLSAQDAQGAIGDGGSGGGGRGGLIGSLMALGALGGGGGAAGGGGIAGGIGIAALIAAPTGLLGIIPAAASAAGGIAAFGALAYPTFTTVTGAVSALATDTAAYKAAVGDVAKDQAFQVIRQQWASLDPVQKQMVKGVQAIQNEFGKLATAFEPKLMPIFTDVFLALSKILPQLVPFADVAAKAIDGLLQQFNKFLSSPGFAAFRAEMLQLEGPAIMAIGHGLGELVIALGKLLMALANPAALKVFNALINVLAGAITGLAAVIDVVTPLMIRAWHDVAVNFDVARHNIAGAADGLVHIFEGIYNIVVSVVHGVTGFLLGWGHSTDNTFSGIIHAGDTVLQWFGALPGRIVSFLGSLPSMLFGAGQRAIQGLISGIQSMFGSLGSVVSSIASKVAGFFGLSPAVEGPLSGGGAPFIRGQHLIDDLAAGVMSRQAALGAAVAGAAHAAALGSYGSAGGQTVGQQHIVLEIAPGGDGALTTALLQVLRHQIRIRGGNVQLALGRP